jgi:hypothetical protein
MNVGVLRESDPLDRRVALTPPVVRQLVERGNTVCSETLRREGRTFQLLQLGRRGTLRMTLVRVRSKYQLTVTPKSADAHVGCLQGHRYCPTTFRAYGHRVEDLAHWVTERRAGRASQLLKTL